MSQDRRLRREEREREMSVRAAARAEEQARLERRAERLRALGSRLPARRNRQTGILAERRRRQTAATIAILVTVNVLVFAFVPEWSGRITVLLVSILAAPVLHTLLFRR